MATHDKTSPNSSTPQANFGNFARIGRVTTTLFAALVAAVTFVAVVLQPDQIAALALVPPWCWLIAGILATLFVWRFRQRVFAVALAAFWTLFAAVWVEEIPAIARLISTAESPSEGTRLRVVTLNCANSEKCLADLQHLNADVVLIQEAPNREALARMVAGLFGEQGEFVTTGDVAILTRGTFSEQFGERGGAFVGARLHLQNGTEVQCVSLRLAPPPPRLDPWSSEFWSEHRKLRETHRRQLAQLKVALAKQEGHSALVVGGDFNTMPLDAAMLELKPELMDTFTRRGVGWGGTGTNEWPLFRVDQIWTNSKCNPVRVSAVKTAHSDHRMVVCDVDLSK